MPSRRLLLLFVFVAGGATGFVGATAAAAEEVETVVGAAVVEGVAVLFFLIVGSLRFFGGGGASSFTDGGLLLLSVGVNANDFLRSGTTAAAALPFVGLLAPAFVGGAFPLPFATVFDAAANSSSWSFPGSTYSSSVSASDVTSGRFFAFAFAATGGAAVLDDEAFLDVV